MTKIIECWEDLSEDLYKYTDVNGDVYYYSKKIRDRKCLNREDGPAVASFNGNKFWYTDGKCNRKDGPAVEYWDASVSWYLQHIEYSKSEYFLVIL